MLATLLFNVSKIERSNSRRYIRVVFSEVCPKHSLITTIDAPLSLAIIAHE